MVHENITIIILCRDGLRRKDKQMGKYEIELDDLNELENKYGVTIKGRQPKRKEPKMKKERREQKNVPDWKKIEKNFKRTKPFLSSFV